MHYTLQYVGFNYAMRTALKRCSFTGCTQRVTEFGFTVFHIVLFAPSFQTIIAVEWQLNYIEGCLLALVCFVSLPLLCRRKQTVLGLQRTV